MTVDLATWQRRDARRREQYRRSATRRRDLERFAPALVGFLHNLSCDGEHRRPRRGCVPIPMFDRPPVRIRQRRDARGRFLPLVAE